MSKLYLNNNYIIVSDYELGSDDKSKYVLRKINDNMNEKEIDEIINDAIKYSYSKLFNCKFDD